MKKVEGDWAGENEDDGAQLNGPSPATGDRTVMWDSSAGTHVGIETRPSDGF